MMGLLNALEPRLLVPNQLLFKEKEVIIESYFMTKGSVQVGFLPAKTFMTFSKPSPDEPPVKYMIRLEMGSVVGVEMLFSINSKFFYKSVSYSEAFSIRRTNWVRIAMSQLGDSDAQLSYKKILFKFKRRLLYDYFKQLYTPM